MAEVGRASKRPRKCLTREELKLAAERASAAANAVAAAHAALSLAQGLPDELEPGLEGDDYWQEDDDLLEGLSGLYAEGLPPPTPAGSTRPQGNLGSGSRAGARRFSFTDEELATAAAAAATAATTALAASSTAGGKRPSESEQSLQSHAHTYMDHQQEAAHQQQQQTASAVRAPEQGHIAVQTRPPQQRPKRRVEEVQAAATAEDDNDAGQKHPNVGPQAILMSQVIAPMVYRCRVPGCNKEYKQSSSARRHERTHGPPQFPCSVCGKQFPYRNTLRVHMQTHNKNTTKLFACEVCGRQFRRLADSKVHMRLHTGEKPYHCETCGRHFAQSSNFVQHRKICVPAILSPCTLCKKVFENRRKLERHMATVHSEARKSEAASQDSECISSGSGSGSSSHSSSNSSSNSHSDKQGLSDDGTDGNLGAEGVDGAPPAHEETEILRSDSPPLCSTFPSSPIEAVQQQDGS